MKAIQHLTVHQLADEAHTALRDQSHLDGYLGGRILPKDPVHKHYRTQVFFEATGVEKGDSLPEGMKLVTILDGQRESLGIVPGSLSLRLNRLAVRLGSIRREVLNLYGDIPGSDVGLAGEVSQVVSNVERAVNTLELSTRRARSGGR